MKRINQDTQLYLGNDEYEKDNRLMMMTYCRRIYELLNESYGEVKNLKVLELGIGHGITTTFFDAMFNDYTVIDGDLQLVNQYKKKHSLTAKIVIEFFEEYDSRLKYDVIIMGFVLEHVDDVGLILTKYKNMLRDGGKLYITVPNALTLNRRVGYEANILKDLYQLSEHDLRAGHKRYFDTVSLRKVCEEHHLQIDKMEGLYLKPLTTKQMASLNLPDEVYEAFCNVGRNYPELCLGIMAECSI